MIIESQQDQYLSTPLPLDHAAREAAANGEAMMAERGEEMIEELLSLPKDFAIIEGQHDRWSRSTPGHERWANIAKICTEFYEGDQWTEEERQILESEGRPVVTKNKISPLMRLLLGFHRQNRYDLHYWPGSDGTGTAEIAEILTAVAKQTSEINGTPWNNSLVFQDGMFGGRGFWDMRLDFTRNRLGEIKESVLDPFSLYVDPEASTYDPNGTGGMSGWKYQIYNRWMTPIEIFTLYGGMPLAQLNNSMSSMPIAQDYYYGNRTLDISPERWFGMEEYLFQDYEHSLRRGGKIYDHINRNRKLIRVLDCQHRQLKRCHFFVDLETGQEKIIPDGTDMNKIKRIMQLIEARGLPVQVGTDYKEVIRWTVTAGDRVLYDKWSPYEHYTVVPYFPYFRRGKTKSPIEDLLDPQREINKRSSAFLHIIMSTANSGWMWEDGALDEEMETILEEEGSRPGIHLKYQEGYEAPQRIQPAATPMNVKRLEDDATRDIKEIAGINDSALGQLDRVQSGKAIEARQRQSIIGAETYFDNFAHSQEIKGRVTLSIVQNYYTEPRLVRARGTGNSEEHMINVRTAAGEIANNITVGKYEVTVDATPMSATFRQAQFEDAMELVEKGIAIPQDILIDLSNVARKEEIKQRLDEQRLIEENNARLANIMQKMQMGVPVQAPVPPIVTDGQPPVVEMQPGGMPQAGNPNQPPVRTPPGQPPQGV